MDALRKMSLMPAQRLGIQSKGRLQVGADADIAVFDLERVIERATFDEPAQHADGIAYVLVNGVFVVKDGKLAVGSMGDDTPPAAVLDTLPRRLEDHFKLRFAQETSLLYHRHSPSAILRRRCIT